MPRPEFDIATDSRGQKRLWLNGEWKSSYRDLILFHKVTELYITWDPALFAKTPAGPDVNADFFNDELCISNFRIRCALPIDLTPVLQSSTIVAAEIDCPKMKQPLDFSRLKNLKRLNVVWNKKISSLTHLSGLSSLSIQNYPYTTLSELKKMTQLERLELIGSRKLTSLEGLGAFSHLVHLYVESAPYLANISEIENIPYRGDVLFDRCKLVSAMGL